MSELPAKEYSNGEVTITWNPETCTHSGKCVRGLPSVFNPQNRPWITAESTETEVLVEQIKKCPSGALGFFFKEK